MFIAISKQLKLVNCSWL